MIRNTPQLNKWTAKFGENYTKRNTMTLSEMDKYYKDLYGITRKSMNFQFLNKLNNNIKILEVGSNIGLQLQLLQKMGYRNLYGIEPMDFAVEHAYKNTCGINIIKGNSFDIPFKDGYFDLVFTSGVLIHISPDDIGNAIKEIYRSSNKYIWGFEYFSETYKNITYRGNLNLLWKTDFPGLFKKLFPDLEQLKIKKFQQRDSDKVDIMYLFRKK
jgi:pseudaminic acid biosynthesis-associated methylase